MKSLATTVFPKRLGRPSEFARLVAHIVEIAYINATRRDGGARAVAAQKV